MLDYLVSHRKVYLMSISTRRQEGAASIEFVIVFVLFLNSSAAQNIKGKVVDSSNNTAMAFVSISVKGTLTGSFSDIDGNFSVQNSLKTIAKKQ